MLTKDLLRTSLRAGKLHPLFLDVNDNRWITVSQELLNIFQNSVGETEENISQACDACILKSPDAKIARGLQKTIRMRAVFSGETDHFPYAEYREKLFLKTSQLLRAKQLPRDINAVKATVHASMQTEMDSLLPSGDIYGDLPEKEVLVKFKTTYVNECIDRYNVGMVQGILLTADAMDITIPAATPPADLRNLLRSIRFFQLLFCGFEANGKILFHIDGPSSILENSQKYGLQFACFFPSVCRLPQWNLRANVKKGDRDCVLFLSDKDNLKSYRAQISGPMEEYKMFFDYFKTQNTDWEINDQPGFLKTDVQELIFPDFSFSNKNNPENIFYLELFHRWHATQLEKRLDWCEKNGDFPLILGIDKSLLKKDGVLKQKLAGHPYFQKKGFLFRDFPGVENVCKTLDNQNSNQGKLL